MSPEPIWQLIKFYLQSYKLQHFFVPVLQEYLSLLPSRRLVDKRLPIAFFDDEIVYQFELKTQDSEFSLIILLDCLESRWKKHDVSS
ncbi:hypothetical protein BZZ01_03775 [Nostocales cyanobacterium HT-58-2]|nr:hypothetical protein BZZ01_03775 [Nostocales cyanobacterium HT-58-2]